MSLRDDIEAMYLHKDNGTLAEYMAGTAPLLPPHDEPHPTLEKARDKAASIHAGFNQRKRNE